MLTIGNMSYTMIEDQFDNIETLDERHRFKCDIIDYAGTTHFVKGEQVLLTDPVRGTIFDGVINSDKETPYYPSGAILHSIDCVGWGVYAAGKRTYTRVYTTPQPAGKLVVDQLNDVLLAEGIGQNFALNYDSTPADFNMGILSGTTGRSLAGDGDLELTPAGADLSIAESTTAQFATGTLANMSASANALKPTTVNAIKMQSTLSFAYGVEFAQAQQTASGTASGSASGTVSGNASGTVSGTASGTVSGNASGTVSANPSGNLNVSLNTSTSYTPSGNISISSGSPGESATFSGSGVTLNPTGNLNTTVNTSFSTNPTLPFSTGASLPFSTSATLPFSSGATLPFSTTVSSTVTQLYQPKLKSKVKIDESHFGVITVDAAVADNRVDAMIWTGSYTIGVNDTLFYDIWIASSSPSQEGGVELYFNDGTALTEYLGSLDTNFDVGVWDQNLVSGSPIQDLSDHARDTWYTRQINLGILSGKVITGVAIFNAANIAGVFDIYIKNCYLGSHSGTPFFGTTQTTPTLNPPVVASIGAYITAATFVTVVPVYDPAICSRISPAYSIDVVKLVKSSLLTWIATIPTVGPGVILGSPGGATVAGSTDIFASYDGTTWLPCTNNQPLPGLPAGANVTGLSLYLLETFSGGQDPTAIPSLLSVNISIASAVNASTADSVTLYGSTAAWNTGTEQGTAPNANGDLVLGTTSYSWANLGNMTWVPGNTNASNPTQSVSGGAYTVSTPSTGGSSGNAWSASRFNFIAAVQNFTAEADFTLNGGGSPLQNEVGFLYRQTYWGSPNNSFAYYVSIQQGSGAGGPSVTLGFGYNNPPSTPGLNSSGPFTVIKKIAETITNNVTYHLKLVVGQNRHTVYWNGGSSPIIDILDNTYTAAGNIGLRTYAQNSSAGTAKIANFSVTNTFAGLWTSPAISLNSLGTCGNTQICWSEINLRGNTQSTIAVMASLNGGTTWQQCTNGAVTPDAIIPGLPVGTSTVGKSLTIQVILAATGFLVSPIVSGLYIRVCGAYPSVTGTRSTAPLGIDNTVRGNQSGWGTAQDTQTWVKTGTGTDAIASNEATITNTTGDVHMVLGSRTGTDMETTVREQLSASTIQGGPEVRYVDANNFYRLAVSTTGVSIIKKIGGVATTLSTAVAVIPTGTYYYARFRVIGSWPAQLFGKVWVAGSLEPGVSNGVMSPTTPQWSVVANDY